MTPHECIYLFGTALRGGTQTAREIVTSWEVGILMDTCVNTRVWTLAWSVWHDPTKAQFPDFVCLEPLNAEGAP